MPVHKARDNKICTNDAEITTEKLRIYVVSGDTSSDDEENVVLNKNLKQANSTTIRAMQNIEISYNPEAKKSKKQ